MGSLNMDLIARPSGSAILPSPGGFGSVTSEGRIIIQPANASIKSFSNFLRDDVTCKVNLCVKMHMYAYVFTSFR